MTTDLVYRELKEKLEGMGCRCFSSNIKEVLGRGGFVLKGFLIYEGDSAPAMFVNLNMSGSAKNHTIALLIAHSESFLGKDFRVELVITDRGPFLMQQERGVYEDRSIFKIPALYEAHITGLAYGIVDAIRDGDGKQ